MNYNKLNNLVGWFVFLIATTVYFITLEDTVSLWDCGEYITAAYKLEVGHPPGAPLFMLVGRLFSFFAQPDMVAVCINRMSALSSSFTILFMFWSITMLSKKILQRNTRELSKGDQIAILGSGIVGALAYTFSDSFWFSAVEGEVYAMSSLFTALIFWAILKWDAEMIAIKHQELNPDRSPMRWMIIIMFLFGLAIGVHLLGLLAIPAIAYIIYFNIWEKVDFKGFFLTGILSIFILAFVQEGVIPGTIAIASSFEVGFVNSLGLPFFSGTIFFFALMVLVFAWGLRWAKRKNRPIVSTIIWSFVVLFIGYGSFATIVIRSNANTPLDENDPENLVTLHAYLKREQYGSWPILYGPYWNSQPEDASTYGDLSPFYVRRFVVERSGTDFKAFRSEKAALAAAKEMGAGYEVVEKYFSSNENVRKNSSAKMKYVQNTFLPRMYYSQNDGNKIEGYKRWSGYTDEPGEGTDNLRLPTFGENMRYMFSYQMNWMYWRYFMWNFAGRQNDFQGHGDALHGNWLSGFSFIDNDRLGNMDEPPMFTSQNEGYNRFFFLPLILGLIGMIFHFYRTPKDAFVVFLTFLFTGIAIIIYLNQKPYEPRERDYAFAASFYAFAMWIGIGVLALYEAYKNFEKKDWRSLGVVAGGGSIFFLFISLFSGLTVFKSWFIMIVIAGILLGLLYFLRKALKNQVAGASVAVLLSLIVPFVMAQQGWDDHDRSDKTSARDLAHNYLMSCAPNSILFTSGDNDTFPLWYYQEVEGQRTDVRVCNTSLFQTDWYTEQMKLKAYKSEALPISFREEQILSFTGGTDQVGFLPLFELARRGISRETLEKVFDIKVRNNKAAYVTAYNKYREIVSGMIGTLTAKDPNATARLEAIRKAFSFSADSSNYAVIEDMTNGIFEIFQGYSSGLIEGDQQSLQQMQEVLQSWETSWDYMPIKDAIAFIQDDKNMIENNNMMLRVFPCQGFILPINVDNAVKSGIITAGEKDQCQKDIRFSYTSQGITKEELMIIDILGNNDWKRAVYFSSPGGVETAMAIAQTGHLRQNGMTWEVSPIRSQGGLNDERMYHHLMETYTYGDFATKDIYCDYYSRRQVCAQLRSHFAQLAEFYVNSAERDEQNKVRYPMMATQIRAAGNARQADSLMATLNGVDARIAKYKKRAVDLIKYSLKVMPVDRVIDFGEPQQLKKTNKGADGSEYPAFQDGTLQDYVTLLYRAGDKKDGEKLGAQVADQLESIIHFFESSDPEFAGGQNLGYLSSAINNYLMLYTISNDATYGDGNGALAKRTKNYVNKLYGTTLPTMYKAIEAKAVDNGEVVRRGSNTGHYAALLFQVQGNLDAVGISYGIIGAPEAAAPPAGQQQLPQNMPTPPPSPAMPAPGMGVAPVSDPER